MAFALSDRRDEDYFELGYLSIGGNGLCRSAASAFEECFSGTMTPAFILTGEIRRRQLRRRGISLSPWIV
jgi:hypothetical protein